MDEKLSLLPPNTNSSQFPPSQVQQDSEPTQKLCRLCHGTEGNDFIVPCKCTGSMKYVHRKCLDQWRTVSPNQDSFYQCDVCTFNYVIREEAVDKTCCPPWVTFISLMTFDIGLTLFIWQVLVFCMVGLVALFDMERARDRIHWFNGWPKFVIDYLSGLTIFFFVLGCLGISFGFVKIFMWLTGWNDCCSYKYEATTYRYNYYHYDPMWDIFFFWYWWSIWTPNRVYLPPISHGGNQFASAGCCNGPCIVPDCGGADCSGLNCNCSGGDCNSGGGNGDGALGVLVVILVVIFIVIVLIGVFIGVMLLFKIVYDITVRRSVILQKRAMVMKTVVCEIQQ